MNNRVLKITLASILVLIIISLTTFLVLALMNKNMSFGSWGFNAKTELIKTENHNYGDIYNIKVDTKSSDVKIIPTDNNQITVNVYGQKDQKVNVFLEKGILNVEYYNEFLCFGFCNMDSYIEIKIPKGYVDDLVVNTVSGDIYVGDNAMENIKLKSVSGDISIENSNKINVTSTSGNVKVMKAEDLVIKTVSGDLKINTVSKSLSAETTSGEVEVERLEINSDSDIKTVSGDVEIGSINNIYVDTSTLSGDVKIKNNNRLADIVLSIHTTSGDIEVN